MTGAPPGRPAYSRSTAPLRPALLAACITSPNARASSTNWRIYSRARSLPFGIATATCSTPQFPSRTHALPISSDIS
jgi:hypothetical protein